MLWQKIETIQYTSQSLLITHLKWIRVSNSMKFKQLTSLRTKKIIEKCYTRTYLGT